MSKMQDEVIGKHQRRKDDEQNPRPMVKNATDLQRLKLEKLMKFPEKPVIIPEHPREKDYDNAVPSFVRNVMGSSAGAGSGEFHVYRHLRRKEYARQKQIQAKSVREQLDDDFRDKIELHRLASESKTAKKRAKRQKKKEKMKQKGKRPKVVNDNIDDATNTNSEDSDEDKSSENDIEESNIKLKDDSSNSNPGTLVENPQSEEVIDLKNTEDKTTESETLVENPQSEEVIDLKNTEDKTTESETLVENPQSEEVIDLKNTEDKTTESETLDENPQSDEVIDLKNTEDKTTESEILEVSKQTDEADTKIVDK